jgi:hypothetical protein
MRFFLSFIFLSSINATAAKLILKVEDSNVRLSAYLVELSMEKLNCNAEVFEALKADAISWKKSDAKESFIINEFKRYKIQERLLCKMNQKIKTH